jgi:hypothetical protein
MASPLLVVEEAHPQPRQGVVLSPRFVPAPSLARAITVRLELPGGAERTTAAELQFSHVRGPLPPVALLRLPSLSPEDVPPGTKVWLVE